MTTGLAKLVDILVDCFWWFVPFTVCDHYERGVVLRFGKFNRLICPGLIWMYPFGIEEVMVQNIKPDGYFTKNQTIMLTDGIQISVSSIVLWEVVDVKQLLLEVEDLDTVLNAVLGYIADFLGDMSYVELQKLRQWASESGKRDGVRKKLIKQINGELEPWAGIKLKDLRLSDFAATGMKHGTLRIML
jgi:regulator of protease activity HflC (stomatin/prohibitin superfamily)